VRDFGAALFEIAARFSGEVAERLDRNGEKATRGLLDWLGIEGAAARAARVPVVLKLADKTPRPVTAPAAVRLRADAGGASVTLETETGLTLAPARLAALVAVDPAEDAFYLPPPGIASVEPAPPRPDAWLTRSFAPAGAAVLQLDPALGLEPGMLVEAGGAQYEVLAVDKDIVTLDRPLQAAEGLAAGSRLTRVQVFAPFAAGVRNRQQHALYIGDAELLNVESASVIVIHGVDDMPAGTSWEYWGRGAKQGVAWQALAPAPAQDGYQGIALRKPKGALEVLKLGEVEGRRWIRATLARPQAPLAIDRIALSLNPPPAGRELQDADRPPVTGVEAIANMTPQVLDGEVYPFGREPRQFDAFYLGCSEVFSKPGARVSLRFDLAEPAMRALALVPFANSDMQVLAGLGQDGYLHLFKVDGAQVSPLRAPVRPPSPGELGARNGELPVMLDGHDITRQPACPCAWVAGDREFFVVVSAGARTWVWHEFVSMAEPSRDSGWIDYGVVGDASSSDPVVDLVQARGCLYALRGGALYRRRLGADAAWEALQAAFEPAPAAGTPLAALAPVLEADGGRIDPGNVNALCAVAEGGATYVGLLDDTPALRLARLEGLAPVDPAVRPLALMGPFNKGQRSLLLVAVRSAKEASALVSFLSGPDNQPGARTSAGIKGVVTQGPALHGGPASGRDLGVAMPDGQVAVWACTRERLTGWAPPGGVSLELAWPADFGYARGAPVVARDSRLIVPGPRGDLLIGDVTAREDSATLAPDRFRDALVSATAMRAGDSAMLELSSWRQDLVALESDGVGYDGASVYVLPAERAGTARAVRLYPTSQAGSKAKRDGDRSLLAEDPGLAADAIVLMRYAAGLQENRVKQVIGSGEARRVVFAGELPKEAEQVEYWHFAADTLIRPAVILDAGLAQRWGEALDGKQPLHFDGLEPDRQPANVIARDERSCTVLLGERWKRQPVTGVHASVRTARLDWKRHLGDTSNNPELSWEYSNGSTWWKLPGVVDRTANFQRSDTLSFTVPDGLAESEWMGRKNHWIRARLVGGDYGRELVTATTTAVPGKDGQTTQQISRDVSPVRAPVVLRLGVSYTLDPSVPASVLSEDGASIRDQSEANRVSGAAVEAFVPLADMLGRLDGGPAPAPGRALYLGFDGRLEGDALKLLVLAAAGVGGASPGPVRIEVLRGARFEPVVSSDATRGLVETGLLSMALPAAAEPAHLFGSTLAWLRLRPAARDAGYAWAPALRGMYLNAVWARAAETQTAEMLGSSNGAPLQQVLLARPPALDRTLELRVREPLGEQERVALLAADPRMVRSRDGGQAGDWVLWEQVTDPADHGPAARVYALDADSGVVRFGDGRHGAIPPIGRDAIMAFSYQRTEAGAGLAPANAITAGSSLGIVTPVEGAEAAFAADQAAGGMPPETPERVLRAAPSRLRQRGRALTARDLEDLALQRFPELVQARALAHGRTTRLVLVTREADPRPAPALLREVRRELLGSAAPALAAPGAFEVGAARLRPFRVSLELAIATLDLSATVADASRKALRAWFDSALGGRDGQGWPLGAQPDETGIAACLLRLEHLDGVAGVELTERTGDGAARPLQPLRADELAVLDLDGITLQFKVPEEAP
jgi:hypothetical protein